MAEAQKKLQAAASMNDVRDSLANAENGLMWLERAIEGLNNGVVPSDPRWQDVLERWLECEHRVHRISILIAKRSV